jgi:predicted ATP-dependent serine protease
MHKDGMKTPKKKIIIDIENKAEVTFQVNKRIERITDDIVIFNPRAYDNEYNIDYIKTYKNLETKLNEIKKKNEFDIIIIDSINYLRNPICSEYWKATTGKKGIMEDAWRYVNQEVQNLIFPLAQYCRIKDKTLIFTCHLKDHYENNVCIGREPDIKEWVEHLGDVILILESHKNEYTAKCIRSSCGYWESDITETSIDVLLEEKGLI